MFFRAVYTVSASCLLIKNHRLYRLSLILSLPLIIAYFAFTRVPTFNEYKQYTPPYEIERYKFECLERQKQDVEKIMAIEGNCQKATRGFFDMKKDCIARIIALDGPSSLPIYRKCEENSKIKAYANSKLQFSIEKVSYFVIPLLGALFFVLLMCHALPLLVKGLKNLCSWVASGDIKSK